MLLGDVEVCWTSEANQPWNKLFSNLFDHDTSTLQTDRQTDRETDGQFAVAINTALYIASRGKKTTVNKRLCYSTEIA